MKGVEEYFKGLADINRLRIINLLLQGELCGCDIQYVVGSSQSNVSRHLTYLKRSGLVIDRRKGYRVYYRLISDSRPEYTELLAYLKLALTDKTFTADTRKLKQAIKDGSCTISEATQHPKRTAITSKNHVRRQSAR
jgi:ArsR family transcriptional regulator, arsenate/arsenite/antimonite-responsive transcriptional repressor